MFVELMGKNCQKKTQKWPKNQFFDFWDNRVRLPGGPIFGLLASLGSHGHGEMRGIFGEYFLYQSQFRLAVRACAKVGLKNKERERTALRWRAASPPPAT